MFGRIALGLGFLILLLVVGFFVLGLHFMSDTVPSYSGSESVTGISTNVDIDRDEYAIPHIHAATERDAYYGLGFAEAQDRLFQMEMERRIGTGRMSELFGKRTLTIDQWARTVGFSRIADQMWQKAGTHTREVVSAFVSGINAYLKTHRTHLGFEFDALSLVPEDWRPQDCMIVGRLMSWEMNFAALTDAAFSDFALTLDSAHLNSLFPTYPDDGATVLDGADPKNFVSNYLKIAPVVAKISAPVPVNVNHDTIPAQVIKSVKELAPAPKRRPEIVAHPKKPAKAKAQLPVPKTPVAPESKPPVKPPKPHIPIPPPRIGAIAPNEHLLKTDRDVFTSVFSQAQIFDSIIGAFLGGGSNSFTIAPSRSTSGGAMLENDTHLQLQSPSRWYIAQMSSDDGINVAGFLIPGMPAILAGRTKNLAWGITSGMADECDYFIEKLDSSGTKYMLPNGTSEKFTVIHDTIHVKDSTTPHSFISIPFEVRTTAHGPIISAMHPDSLIRIAQGDPRAGGMPDTSVFNKLNKPVSLMWNGTYAITDELSGFLALPRATSVTQARNGMASYATPCLNLCLADINGNISYQYIGRLPRRAGSSERLFLPRDATNSADDWQGFIYMPQLPTVTNAARGYIVSANNPPAKNLPVPYGLDWEPSSRADRIAELIETGGKLDASAIQRIQIDIVSPYDLRRVLPYLLALYPDPNPPIISADSTSKFRLDSMRIYWKEDSLLHHGSLSDTTQKLIHAKDSIWLSINRARTNDRLSDIIPVGTIVPNASSDRGRSAFETQVLEYLRNWDGGMRTEEIAPAIYSVFLNRLIYNTYHDALGSVRYAEFTYLDNLALESLARILPDSANVWWHKNIIADNRTTIIQTSFRESLQILALAFGSDIRQWQWGKLHSLTFRHPFDKASKLIAKLVNIEAGPMPGGPTTVQQGAYYLWDPYKMQVGPSMRMIADMKSDELLAVLPTGNAEAVFGSNYADMLALYKTGRLIRIPLEGHSDRWKRFTLRPM